MQEVSFLDMNLLQSLNIKEHYLEQDDLKVTIYVMSRTRRQWYGSEQMIIVILFKLVLLKCLKKHMLSYLKDCD